MGEAIIGAPSTRVLVLVLSKSLMLILGKLVLVVLVVEFASNFSILIPSTFTPYIIHIFLFYLDLFQTFNLNLISSMLNPLTINIFFIIEILFFKFIFIHNSILIPSTLTLDIILIHFLIIFI